MPKKAGCILGIDIGTSRSKASLYSAKGKLLSESSKDHTFTVPAKGYVEEDPEGQWWKATVENIKKIIKSKEFKGKKILAIGVSCANALVYVDKTGKALGPAIMQIDKRSLQEVKYINDKMGEDEIFAITGNRIAPGTFFLPSILWLKENRKDIFKETHKFLSPSGFIVGKLTGKFSIDWTRACTTMLYDLKEKKWSEEIISKFEVPVNKLPDLHKSCQVVAEVDERAAKITGLEKGIPVIAGAMDTVAAGVALDARKAGESFLILGTVGRLCKVLGAQSLLKKEFLNTIYDDEKKFLSIACTDSAGLSIDWFRKGFGSEYKDKDSFDNLEKEAMKSSPGSGGLIYLPYLLGERSPIWDPYVKGVFFGIDPLHKRGDFYRAVMEGIAFSLKGNLELIESDITADKKPLRICESGGGSSKFWRQIISDIIEREIMPCKIESPETLGVSALAAFGIGEIKNTKDFVTKDIKEGKVHKPNKESIKRYNNLFMMFNKLYSDLKGNFRILYEILW